MLEACQLRLNGLEGETRTIEYELLLWILNSFLAYRIQLGASNLSSKTITDEDIDARDRVLTGCADEMLARLIPLVATTRYRESD